MTRPRELFLGSGARYTIAELLELLYVGEEPGFFELMRGLFALSDDNRLTLVQFLAAEPLQTITVAIGRKEDVSLLSGKIPLSGLHVTPAIAYGLW